jgi:hypothetical protein
MPDQATGTEEILRCFDELSRAGKILYAGLSNSPAWRVSGAATLASLRGWGPLVGVLLDSSLRQTSRTHSILTASELSESSVRAASAPFDGEEGQGTAWHREQAAPRGSQSAGLQSDARPPHLTHRSRVGDSADSKRRAL